MNTTRNIAAILTMLLMVFAVTTQAGICANAITPKASEMCKGRQLDERAHAAVAQNKLKLAIHLYNRAICHYVKAKPFAAESIVVDRFQIGSLYLLQHRIEAAEQATLQSVDLLQKMAIIRPKMEDGPLGLSLRRLAMICQIEGDDVTSHFVFIHMFNSVSMNTLDLLKHNNDEIALKVRDEMRSGAH